MAYVVAPNIEPYRKGQSFAGWLRRLTFHFRVNKIQDNDKKDQMFMLGGDYLFSMAEKLYPTEALLDEVAYAELVQKLKERFDRTDSILLQRYHFGSKLQQPGETASDFVFTLKLQAEHCEFGDQKNRLILDRLLVGLTDNNLKHRLLTEDSAKLTLDQAEKIIATWEMAATHTRALANNDGVGLIMVGNEAITTAHPTQIRLVKEGSGSRQPRRSMRVVETGRSIPATAEPEGTVVRDDDIRQLPERNTESEGAAFGETDVRQLPDLSDRERRRNNSAEIIE
ncbi:AAEL015172-PA, partial [Aedes aegypti]